MPSLGTHQPPPWCPGFLPLPLLPHPPTSCLWLTHLTSLPYTSVPFPTLPYTFSLPSSQTSKTVPFQGHPKLLFLSPAGSRSSRVKAQQFHSVPQWADENKVPLFCSPSFPSYIIWNFRPADYSDCHLLSRWYLAWLIMLFTLAVEWPCNLTISYANHFKPTRSKVLFSFYNRCCDQVCLVWSL
jgi:hypothetical protein